MNRNETVGNSYCFHLPDPVFQTVSERISTNLITAVINILAVPIAIMANILILAAIMNCSRLRSPSNLLIASLALSDVLVGVTTQPGYISYRLLENQNQRVPCYVMVLYSVAFYSCFGVSCMTLTAVSCERLVAVRLPGRYITFFSRERVIEYLIGIWTVNILLSALQWAKINQEVRGLQLTLWWISLFFSTATQIDTLFTVRRFRRQLHAELQASINLRRQREVKVAKNISIVVGVYLILNFPVLLVTFYHQILRLKLETYNFYSWAETLAFLNSCSNPIICVWKNRKFRKKIKNILIRIIGPRL